MNQTTHSILTQKEIRERERDNKRKKFYLYISGVSYILLAKHLSLIFTAENTDFI